MRFARTEGHLSLGLPVAGVGQLELLVHRLVREAQGVQLHHGVADREVLLRARLVVVISSGWRRTRLFAGAESMWMLGCVLH